MSKNSKKISSKKKLCWNCEGNVSVSIENCPYCGVYLHPDTLAGKADLDEEAASNDSNQDSQNEEANQAVDSMEPIEGSMASKDDTKKIVGSLALLLSGSVFVLFGLVLFLFSQNGVFTLHWKAAFWYLYLGLGLPMFFWGWKILNEIKEAHE